MTEQQTKSEAQQAAELRKTLAEAEKAELDVQQAKHDLKCDKFNAKRRRREWAEKDASDERSGVYYFNQGVTGTTVKTCREWLNEWSRLNPGKPVEIVLNSPGGSVFDGLDLGDAIEALSAKGHHVTTVVAGMAASMAGVILQFGDTRVIGRNSYLHLHEVSTGAIGKASDLEDTAELAKRLTIKACDIYARRSNKTSDEIHDMMRRQEVWLDADQALELGFVDLIR